MSLLYLCEGVRHYDCRRDGNITLIILNLYEVSFSFCFNHNALLCLYLEERYKTASSWRGFVRHVWLCVSRS